MKNPFLAFFLSMIMPGLGQVYVGEKTKGLTLLCITLGVVVSFSLNRSWLALFLVGFIYLAVMAPAAMDAYQAASGRQRIFSGESIPYVIIMLLTVGPFAVPLLWQSSKFTKGAKIGWTAFVVLMAFLVIGMMVWLGNYAEEIIKQASQQGLF